MRNEPYHTTAAPAPRKLRLLAVGIILFVVTLLLVAAAPYLWYLRPLNSNETYLVGVWVDDYGMKSGFRSNRQVWTETETNGKLVRLMDSWSCTETTLTFSMDSFPTPQMGLLAKLRQKFSEIRNGDPYAERYQFERIDESTCRFNDSVQRRVLDDPET
jgi:hypothetical protein